MSPAVPATTPSDAPCAARVERRAGRRARPRSALPRGIVRAVLLHGVTGSGKTEVYLAAAAQAVARGGQVLILVPEINLTPQFEQRMRARAARRRAP